MNRALIVVVSDEGRARIDAGGLELDTEEGIREAMRMAEFARAHLVEALIELLVQAGKERADEGRSPPGE